jgi:hypothetical protein
MTTLPLRMHRKKSEPQNAPASPHPQWRWTVTIAEFFGMLVKLGFCNNDVVGFQTRSHANRTEPSLASCREHCIRHTTFELPVPLHAYAISSHANCARARTQDLEANCQMSKRHASGSLHSLLQSSSYWHVGLAIRAHLPLRDSPRLLHMEGGSPANQTLERVRWVIPQPHLWQLI